MYLVYHYIMSQKSGKADWMLPQSKMFREKSPIGGAMKDLEGFKFRRF
jgi:hypothetical protein